MGGSGIGGYQSQDVFESTGCGGSMGFRACCWALCQINPKPLNQCRRSGLSECECRRKPQPPALKKTATPRNQKHEARNANPCESKNQPCLRRASVRVETKPCLPSCECERRNKQQQGQRAWGLGGFRTSIGLGCVRLGALRSRGFEMFRGHLWRSIAYLRR